MDVRAAKQTPSFSWFPFLLTLVAVLAALFLLSLAPSTTYALGPGITADKIDSVVDGVNGKANAGGAVRYDVVIRNTGSVSTTNIVFTDTIDTNTTLSGTVKSTPLAFDDAYQVIGNTPINIPAASGLLVNDVDPDGGSIVGIGVYSTTSTFGGSVVINTTNGSFNYTPPVGRSGTDTFWYTVLDEDGNTDRGKVSLNINGMVWYINSASGSGTADGRFTTPFKSLGSFSAVQGQPGFNPKAGDVIYVYGGSYGYSASISLLDGQQFLGQGVNLSAPGVITPVLGFVLPTRTVSPTLSSTSNNLNAIVLHGNNVVRGLTLNNPGGSGTTGSGISGSSLSGVTISEVAIQNAVEDGIKLTDAHGSVTFSNLIVTGSKDRNVLIQNTSGTATLTVSSSRFNNTAANVGSDGFEVFARGTSSVSLTATNSSFNGNQSNGLQGHAEASGVLALNVSSCTFTGNDVGIDAGASRLDSGTGAMATLNINNNTFSGQLNHTINLFSSGYGRMTGSILNNAITQGASASGPGIRVDVDGPSTGVIGVQGNNLTIQNALNTPAIDVLTRGRTSAGAVNLQLTLTGNTISTAGPIGVQVRSMDANALCANITGNTSTAATAGFVASTLDTSRFVVQGLPSGSATATAVAALLNSNNPGSTTASAVASGGTFEGGTCTTVSQLAPTRYFVEAISPELSAARPLSTFGMPPEPEPDWTKPTGRVAGWASPLHADVPPFTIDALPPGKTITLTFSVVVVDPLPPGAVRLVNQGRVSWASSGGNFATLTNDPSTPAPNDATLTPLNLVADLQIAKSDGLAEAVPGRPITYTIVITNPGPNHVVGAVVSDTVPAALSWLTWACATSSGGACASSGSGDISDTVTLLKDGVLTYTIKGTVVTYATGRLTNTAGVTVPIEVVDPTSQNNVAMDADALTPQAALGIYQTDGQVSAVPGTQVTYRVVVSNTGPSDAPGIVVSDTLPATLGGVVWTCAGSGGGTCATSGSDDIHDATVGLPAGSVVTYTITGTVSSSATGNLVNTAAISVPVGVTDLTPGDNLATDTDTLTPQAELSILKDDGLDSAVPGTQVKYRVVVSNSGPSDVPGATVTDTLPAAFTGAVWTCAGTDVGTCAPSGVDDVDDATVDLPWAAS